MKRYKKNYLSTHGIEYIDWRDIHVLRQFLNPDGRLMSKKRTNCTATQQRKLSQAVKRARTMMLLPYTE